MQESNILYFPYEIQVTQAGQVIEVINIDIYQEMYRVLGVFLVVKLMTDTDFTSKIQLKIDEIEVVSRTPIQTKLIESSRYFDKMYPVSIPDKLDHKLNVKFIDGSVIAPPYTATLYVAGLRRKDIVEPVVKSTTATGSI